MILTLIIGREEINEKILCVDEDGIYTSRVKFTGLNEENYSIEEDTELVVAESSLGLPNLIKCVSAAGWKDFRIVNAEADFDGEVVRYICCYKCKNQLNQFYGIVSGKTLSPLAFIKAINRATMRFPKQESLRTVKEFMTKCGIYSNFTGYDYLLDCFVYSFADRKLLNKLTTVLYPLIAEKHGVNKASVERDMRTVIENCCNTGKFYKVANTFGGNFDKYEKPTTGEFVAFLVDRISAMEN